MTSHESSRRTSLETAEKETPFTSTAPSLYGEDIEAQQYALPQRIPTHTCGNKEGAPLEISPSHLSQPPQPGIPNGGFTAWLQVVCGFMMFFNCWYAILIVYYLALR